MVMALVWSCCWMIQVIAGTPVGTPEMDRAFGAPLTAAELACVPTFGKAGKNIVFDFFMPFNFLKLILIVNLSSRRLPHVRGK